MDKKTAEALQNVRDQIKNAEYLKGWHHRYATLPEEAAKWIAEAQKKVDDAVKDLEYRKTVVAEAPEKSEYYAKRVATLRKIEDRILHPKPRIAPSGRGREKMTDQERTESLANRIKQLQAEIEVLKGIKDKNG